MKISELTSASALDGTELLPVVQSTTTKKGLISAIRSYLLALANTWTGIQTFNVGASVPATNPTVGSDTGFRRGLDVNVIYNSAAASSPGFTTNVGMYVGLTSQVGHNLYGAGTNSKKTLSGLNIGHTAYGAGQRFCDIRVLDVYGMGDAFISGQRLVYASGPGAGDEGIGFGPVNYVIQASSLVKTTIASIPTQSTINTTTTQAITASVTAQTVTVASSTGASVGQWVVVGQEVASGFMNLEAVQLTGVAAGSITGVFMANHASGVTVTPAKVLTLTNAGSMGEQRVLVNLSGASYTTGTVSSISGGGFTGSGTVWTNGMVGGTATNVGAIALTADDYTGSPFSGGSGPLKSWYQIPTVVSNTSLAIHSFSVAADASYHGNGVSGTGAYTIRPAGRILYVNHPTVVLETSAHTWTAGDTVECAISPYPDVSAHQENLANYTTGGTLRGWCKIKNIGARTYGTGLSFWNEMQTGGGAQTSMFDHCFLVNGEHGRGITMSGATTAAIQLYSASDGYTDLGGKIVWGGSRWIMPNIANGGMDFRVIETGSAGGLTLQFTAQSVTGKSQGQMKYGGAISAGTTGWFELPVYTVSSAPSASTCGEGSLIYVSNGSAGSKCAAISDGTNWKVIALGATIS